MSSEKPMTTDATNAHPYMANSIPAIKRAMLDVIGADSIEELFTQIPEDHRIGRAPASTRRSDCPWAMFVFDQAVSLVATVLR